MAQAVTWDGGGVSDTSGTWETGGNWDPDGVPLSSDSVLLGDVTSGTRTVTISSGSAQAINDLTITQTTGGAVNKLSVEENLTISGSSTPLTVDATAGSGSVVINVAAGKTLETTRTGSALTSTYGGTLNLLGTGATFKQTSDSGGVTSTFSGPITAAAGSALFISSNSAILNLSGTSSFGTGSTITMQYSDGQGNAIINNSGNLTLDGTTVLYDWLSSSGNNPNSGRNINNTGTWTFKNGASLLLANSTSSISNTGGFSTLTNNNNSGTLNLESGSTLSFRTFFNTGTMNLGSSSVGVSDAQVFLGGNVTASQTFTNGVTSSGAATPGIINILGDTRFGNTTSSATLTVNNGTAASTGSALNIGDGSTDITLTIGQRNSNLRNFAGNTISIKAAGTLLLTTNATGSNGGSVTFTNDGVLRQTGRIQFQSNPGAGSRTFTTSSTGSHLISGTGAVIESLANTGSGTPAAISYTNSGLLGGSSSNDKLTYTNSSGNVARNVFTMTVSSGEIAAGFGSNGSGVSSIGSLEFVNTSLTLSGATTMSFDLGGSVGSGLYDSLSLTGNGAILTLAAGSILDVNLVNGFASANGTYTIVNASSVGGTFGQLLLNGSDAAGAYSINYGADSISITFAAIPEPSSWGLLLGAGASLAALGRRRRQS